MPLDYFFEKPEYLMKIKSFSSPGTSLEIVKEAAYVLSNITFNNMNSVKILFLERGGVGCLS